MAPLNYCERCGDYFTAAGTKIAKAATARGPVFDIPDSVCPRCLKPDELIVNDEVKTVDQLRRLAQ